MDIPCATLCYALLATSALDVLESLLELPVTVFRAYGSLLRWAADSARDLFEDYGYWVVFLGMLFENTLLLGLIVPGVLVILLAGLSAHDGTISLPIALALGCAGTILGDTISYLLGRYGWRHLERIRMVRELEEKAREPIRRRGQQFVLVYHFFGYTRLLGPAAAGLLKMPYRRWAPFDYAGACIWASFYMLIGYGLGMAGFSLEDTDDWIRYLEWGLLVLVLVWGYSMLKLGQKALAADAKDDANRVEATIE